MKRARRFFALLLTLAMVLTYMPAVAFADMEVSADAYPTSIKYVGGPIHYDPEAGDEDDISWSVYDSLYKPGNKFQIECSDNKTRTYVYAEIPDGEDGYHQEFCLEGYKDDEHALDLDSEVDLNTKKVTFYTRYFINDPNVSEDDAYGTVSTSVDATPYPAIQKIEYTGTPLYYEGYDDEHSVDYTIDGAEFTLTFDNGEKEVYKYVNTGTETSEDGYTYAVGDFFKDGDKDKETLSVWRDDDDSRDKEDTAIFVIDYVRKEYSFTVPIAKKVYPKPEKVEFIPATKITALIGQDWFYEGNLFGKGNKFVVTYSDGSKKTFKYGTFKGDAESYEAFGYVTDEGWNDTIYPEFGAVKGFKKGTTTVQGHVSIWADGYDDDFTLPFKVKVKASKYYSYAVCKAYTYTGKTITPKVAAVYVAKDDGKMKKLKASKYTYKPKKAKKIGAYTFKVKLKNKADKKKYGDILCTYAICPKAPTGVSASSKGGNLTVKWKKQKNVDGFSVLVSKKKNFQHIERWEDAGKNKTSLTVNELEKGKTYYVCVVAFKKNIGSNYSKIKKVTIK